MEIDYSHIKVIGFDADDTLWVNETYFREAEEAFAQLLSDYETPNKIDQELFKIEIKNLDLYGYGVKSFILSMVEAALDISNNDVSNKCTLYRVVADRYGNRYEPISGHPHFSILVWQLPKVTPANFVVID